MSLQWSTIGVCHALLWIPQQRHLLHHMVQADHKVSHKVCDIYDKNNDAHPHSTEQDTQPIAFLISKQVIPYQTRGDTCCPGVSTSKIQFLIDSSTTCHDDINHLHHSNRCSNHNIDPHTVISHLDGWKTTTLSQRHKPNSTSQWMERLV
jgi:hypothetical protein